MKRVKMFFFMGMYFPVMTIVFIWAGDSQIQLTIWSSMIILFYVLFYFIVKRIDNFGIGREAINKYFSMQTSLAVKAKTPINSMVAETVIRANGKDFKCNLLIDTGCNVGLVLNKSIIEKMQLIPHPQKVRVESLMGFTDAIEYPCEQISINGNIFKDPHVRESPHANSTYDGLLGLDLISELGLLIGKEKKSGEFYYVFGKGNKTELITNNP